MPTNTSIWFNWFDEVRFWQHEQKTNKGRVLVLSDSLWNNAVEFIIQVIEVMNGMWSSLLTRAIEVWFYIYSESDDAA